MKPKVFIACASTSTNIADALQQNLDDAAEVTIWNQDVFDPGEFTLEALDTYLDTAEFGVFVMTPDDLASIRGKTCTVPRDNVVFELGIFVGRLGRKRCFVIVPKQAKDLQIPSDLAGVTMVSYATRDDDNFKAATRPACATIAGAINKQRANLRSQKLIQRLLRATAQSLTLRAAVDADEVRGFCHLFDAAEETLQPVASYMTHLWKDVAVPVPCPEQGDPKSWYVIAKAFKQDDYQCEEVDWKRTDLAQVPHAMDIKKNIRSIIAHPIRPLPEDDIRLPIGTVSFDSSKSLQDLCWQDDQDDLALRDVLSLLGATVYEVVTRMR